MGIYRKLSIALALRTPTAISILTIAMIFFSGGKPPLLAAEDDLMVFKTPEKFCPTFKSMI